MSVCSSRKLLAGALRCVAVAIGMPSGHKVLYPAERPCRGREMPRGDISLAAHNSTRTGVPPWINLVLYDNSSNQVGDGVVRDRTRVLVGLCAQSKVLSLGISRLWHSRSARYAGGVRPEGNAKEQVVLRWRGVSKPSDRPSATNGVGRFLK